MAAISGVDSIVTIPDVLRPQRRLRLNELCHQRLAPRILQNLDGYPARSQELLLPEEGPVLADDDPRDAVEENCAAAHRAGRQCRVDRALAIDLCRSAAGVFEGVHLAVEHDTPALNAPIVAAPEDSSAMHEDGADGNPALGQAPLRLLDCRSEKLVHGYAPVLGLLVRDQITLSAVAAGQSQNHRGEAAVVSRSIS